MLEEVEKQLMFQFEGHEPRTVLAHQATVGDVLARVSLQCNRRGEPTFRYWFGQSRVDRWTFQTLTCQERRCPQRQAVMKQWLVHTGQAKPARAARPSPPRPNALNAEERIQIDGQTFIAREARFPVTLKCINKAHTPLRISVQGWDVFGDGVALAGGWSGEAPMFETLEQVRQWLTDHTQHVHAHVAIH